MNIAENYRQYLELGGIINEDDYRSAIKRMIGALAIGIKTPRVRSSVAQARCIAEYSGIRLSDSEDAPDPRVTLYVVLRGDTQPDDVKHHHSQMTDQRIFAEVLRMAGDKDSLDKLVKAYPHISFEYKRERQT